MSITGSVKKRRIDCGSIHVGADANIGDDLYVMDDTTIGGDLTVGGTINGSITPSSLSLPDGSASAPSLKFTSGPSTGIYRDTVGAQGFAITTGGTKRLKINNSGAEFTVPLNAGTNSLTCGSVDASSSVSCSSVKVGSGTTLVPALGFASEPTLGIRRGGTGTISFCVDNDDTYVFSKTSLDTKNKSVYGDVFNATTALVAPDVNTTDLKLYGGTANGVTYLDTDKKLKSTALTDGQLLIGRTGNTPLAANIQGTTNRVTVTNSPGGIQLSTPQDIATTSNVNFNSVTCVASVDCSSVRTSASPALVIGNQASLQARNSSGTAEICFIGRSTGNVTSVQYGSGGLQLRNMSANSALSIDNATSNVTIFNSLNIGGQLTSTGQPALYLQASGLMDVADNTETDFNLWNTSSTQGGITVTSNRDVKVPSAGHYMVSVTMIFVPGVVDGVRQFYVKRNGVATPEYCLSQQAQAASFTHGYTSSQMIKLDANDTLTVVVRQTNGGDPLQVGTLGTDYVSMFSIAKLF